MYLPGLLSSSSPLFLLSTLLFNFLAFELLCLFSCVSSFLWNNKKAKKFGAWRWVGSFLHSSLHTLLMFRPPLYFLLQPSNAKGRTDLLVIPPTSLDPTRGRGGMIFNERTFDLGKMLWRGVFVGARWRCF